MTSDHDLQELLRLAGPRPAPAPEARARVHAAVYAAWRREGAARRSRRRAAGALAAAAAVALATLVARPESAPGPAVPPLRVATVERVAGAASSTLAPGSAVGAGTWLQTGQATRAALRLAQGHSLRLDVDTRLQVISPSSLWLERGAVYVDSGGPAALPVRVHGAQGQVRERGTQFQVRVRGERMRVAVREGAVAVSGAGGTAEAAAGTALELHGRTLERAGDAGFGADWRWVEEAAPDYDLEGQPLITFLGWASRETGLQVRFATPALERSARRTLLHGSTRGLTPSEALAAVLPASGLEAERDGGVVWVRGAR